MQLTENEINMYAADFGVQFEGKELQTIHETISHIPSVAIQKRVLMRFFEDCALGALHHAVGVGKKETIIKPVIDGKKLKEYIDGK